MAYIKELPEKHHEQIDLNDPIETQIERIDRLCKRVTVFLSHHRADEPFASRIRVALAGQDYSVWSEKEIAAGTLWQQEITNAIDRAVERGFVLVLLSVNSVESQFIMAEVRHALEKAAKAAHGANIVPVMLDDPAAIQSAIPPSLRGALERIEWFDFSQGNFDANITRLVAHMKSRPMD